MSSQQDKTVSELALCPSCGAAVSPAERRCWLCQWDLSEEIVTAEIVSEPPEMLPANVTRVAMVIGIVALALATIGVFAVAPGIGVLLGVVFVISVFGVSKSMQEPGPQGPLAGQQDAIAAAYSAPATGGSTGAMSVVAAIFKVLGIILLVALAALIAFFTFCVICIVVVSNM